MCIRDSPRTTPLHQLIHYAINVVSHYLQTPEHWLQTCLATQQQQVQIFSTADPPLNIITYNQSSAGDPHERPFSHAAAAVVVVVVIVETYTNYRQLTGRPT